MDRIKLVMLGDQSTGKTSLVMRYVYDNFHKDYMGTIGIDFLSLNHRQNGNTYKIQIWDTAGQERFRSLIPSYVRDSRVALVVFDGCNVKSFENVQWWVDMINREKNRDNLIIGIIGNKIDKEEHRMISTSDARDLARNNNVFYTETSAKTGHKVKSVFNMAVSEFVNTKFGNIDGQAGGESAMVEVSLAEEGQQEGKRAGGCCFS